MVAIVGLPVFAEAGSFVWIGGHSTTLAFQKREDWKLVGQIAHQNPASPKQKHPASLVMNLIQVMKIAYACLFPHSIGLYYPVIW